MHSDKGFFWLSFSVFKCMFEMAIVFHTDLKRVIQHLLRKQFGRKCTLSVFGFFSNLDNNGKNMWPKENFIIK